MKKALPLGIMYYEQLIKNDYYFVDKSLMIKEYLESKRKATLITRPRRFGKTLNMSMMAEFFDITKDSKELFKDTKIIQSDYACEMNQWPTIFISFANAKGNKQEIIKAIRQEISREYQKNNHLFMNLDDYDQATFDLIKKSLLDSESELDCFSDSLSFLMKKSEEYYHKKAMVFIDEYDTPFIEAHVNGFYNEIRNGLASILHNALKSSSSLQYAMLTGIQRVAKENIFSDLNNLVVCGVKDKEYSKYFGFNAEETKTLLEYYGLELSSQVKEMYDGYRFGNEEIYNPWSIINYADKQELEPYWVNTSANQMIKTAMKQSDASFKKGYETLIKQGYLDTQVLMETSFFEESQTQSLWGLFINAGYLTIDKKIAMERYRIKIPNMEVQNEFKSLTAYHLNVSNTTLNDLFYALETSDRELFIDSYRDILLTMPSYHDLKSENSYHMMMLGMCAWLSYDYEISSNKETGKGRSDILLKTKKAGKPSYVIEFKYCKNEEELKEAAQEAVDQIIRQKYDCELIGDILYIGLAHCGKEVEMKWLENN